MKHAIRLDVGLGSTVQVTQEQYPWDFVLTKSLRNKWPLASSDLVKAGLMDDVRYEKGIDAFSAFCNMHMLPELVTLTEQPSFKEGPTQIEILSGGLLHAEQWITTGVSLGLSFGITDSSHVSCENSRTHLGNFFPYSLKKIEIREMDVEDAWLRGDIDEEKTLAYYAARFLQNQKNKGTTLQTRAMDRYAGQLGAFLKHGPNRRIYLLHPLGEENPPELVKWKNTTPYTQTELQTAFERGFGGPVMFEIMGKHRYFDHQAYTLFRIRGIA